MTSQLDRSPAIPFTVSGHADPTDRSASVMQLVVLVDKTAPPTRTAACTATATAVMTLLDHPDAAPDGPWAEPIALWLDGRIRKHCRRARGAAWDKVQNLPGVTLTIDGATVRAFVPCPIDQIPPEIARLQMAGTELARADDQDLLDPVPNGPVVVSICPEPDLSFGKAAAAAGHAAQLAVELMSFDRHYHWACAGYPVLVEHPSPARWASELATAPARVVDAGLTDVAPGTTTALARWA